MLSVSRWRERHPGWLDDHGRASGHRHVRRHRLHLVLQASVLAAIWASARLFSAMDLVNSSSRFIRAASLWDPVHVGEIQSGRGGDLRACPASVEGPARWARSGPVARQAGTGWSKRWVAVWMVEQGWTVLAVAGAASGRRRSGRGAIGAGRQPR